MTTWWVRKADHSLVSMSEKLLGKKLKELGEGVSWEIWRPGMIQWSSSANFESLVSRFKQAEPKNTNLHSSEPEGPQSKKLLNIVKELQASTDWYKRLLWFVIVRSLPIIGGLISAGWQLDFMRRGLEHGYPESRRIGYFMSDGILLWLIYAGWVVVLTVFFNLFVDLELTVLDVFLQIVEDIINWLFISTPFPSIRNILLENIQQILVDAVIALIIFSIVWLGYFGGVARYSLRRDKRAFIEIHKNLRLVARYRTVFFYIGLQYILAIIVFATLSFLFLLVPIIGFLVVWFILAPLKDIVVSQIQSQGIKIITPIRAFSVEDI